jgi:GH18 family chitinase
VSVLLGLGGVWCAGDCGGNAFLNHANDATWVHNYVTAVLGYARTQGYDGISLDWEGSVFREGWIRLTDSLRVGLDRWTPRGKFSAAVAGMIPMGYVNPYDSASLRRNIDYVEAMTFDLNGFWNGLSGFNSPLYDPTPNWSGYRGDNVHQSTLNWTARGVDLRRFATGIPFYGFKWWGISGPTQTGWSGNYFTRYHFVLRQDVGQGVQRRDTQSRTPWISKVNGQLGSNETAFIDYHDPIAVTEKVNYAMQQRHGGIMIFDLNSGYLDPQNFPNATDRNPLQTAMRNALGTAFVNSSRETPNDFVLEQNYPNPFNPTTTISYVLPSASHVKLVVLDVLGREVATLVDEEKKAGKYEMTFDAKSALGGSLASGVYLYRVKAGNFSEVKKPIRHIPIHIAHLDQFITHIGAD